MHSTQGIPGGGVSRKRLVLPTSLSWGLAIKYLHPSGGFLFLTISLEWKGHLSPLEGEMLFTSPIFLPL